MLPLLKRGYTSHYMPPTMLGEKQTEKKKHIKLKQ